MNRDKENIIKEIQKEKKEVSKRFSDGIVLGQSRWMTVDEIRQLLDQKLKDTKINLSSLIVEDRTK